MFREMRRKSKAVSDAEAKALLHSARIGILAVNGDGGYPYAVPVNYLYDEENDRIIFHGARAGHKADALNASDRVCFTVYGAEVVKKESWAPFVQSVVAFGRCRPLQKPEEALEALTRLALKYYPNMDEVDREIQKSGEAVCVFEIQIEHMRGKEIQEK